MLEFDMPDKVVPGALHSAPLVDHLLEKMK